METLLNLLTVLLPLAYGLATVNYVAYFQREDPFAKRTCTPFLVAVVVLHALYLALRVAHYHQAPIVGLASVLSLIALGVAGVYLYLERIQRNKFTGTFILPLVVLLHLMASALMTEDPGPRSALLDNQLFALHAVVAALGYAAFGLGAVYGLMYLLLYRSLKAGRFGLVFERLPSLDVLAEMGFGATFLGWLALTITISLGVVMSVELIPHFYRDPKFITTVVVWGVYSLGVGAHFLLGWRGARMVYVSLAGFALAVVAMVGSNYLWPSFHSFQA